MVIKGLVLFVVLLIGVAAMALKSRAPIFSVVCYVLFIVIGAFTLANP